MYVCMYIWFQPTMEEFIYWQSLLIVATFIKMVWFSKIDVQVNWL